jgi:hypothetical protein
MKYPMPEPMKKTVFLFASCMLAAVYISCNKESASILPYIGTWETDVYTVPIDTLGSLENQRMVFVLGANNFSDTVYHVIGYLEQPVFCANGSIDRLTDNQLNFAITQVGEIKGNHIIWNESGTPAFDSLYTLWFNLVVPVEFIAAYRVTGNHLDLIITEANDTISLSGL